jgi:adenosylcobalamin-dependent ribonucleoside-triphosphate reductase
MNTVPFGPAGRVVFQRTYARTKDDGTKETWPETAARVARGNLNLVYGHQSEWSADVQREYDSLNYYMNNFAIIPAGRHLWASGVTSHLFNCWVAPWGDKFSDHFEFTSNRLFEGGGVGANYSTRHIQKFRAPDHQVRVYLTSLGGHQDIDEMDQYLTVPYTGTVQGKRWDVEDTREGWAKALTNLIDSFFRPNNDTVRWYDVAGIRPSGSPLISSGGTASGPAPLLKLLTDVTAILTAAFARGTLTPMDAMEIDHAIAEAVVAGGTRRSARMSIVRWDDPYIFDFLKCKKDSGKHWTTNISVEIDDEFLNKLNWLGDNKAKEVHAAVCEAMLENGEPGYWNSSLSSVGEIGEVFATNPCGEITLQFSEPCNLGHVNLDYFHDKDWTELVEAHRLVTRFLMRATFGSVNDLESRKILDRNRRIGVGHLGVQGYWAKRGVKYSEISSGAAAVELQLLYKVVRQEAREYAFELRIPEPVKVTTVAPTGSVAKLPGVSEGIHPIYARWYERRIRFSMRSESEWQTVMNAQAEGFVVEDDIYDSSGMTKVVVYPTEDILMEQVRALGLPESVVQSADELDVIDMLSVQRTYQKFWADNAVSYTCNIAEGSVTPEKLASILAKWLPDLKGTTIMVDASRPQAPYKRITKEEYDAVTAKVQEDSTSEECSNGACPVR